jgi:hypothetical protein
MKKRNGEKIGWSGGWLGGFLWALILAIVRIVQHRWEEGFIGLFLVALAAFFIFFFAPWRRPDTAYWKLMVPVYVLLFTAVAWAVWTYGGMKAAELDWWSFFWVLPVLMPLFTTGRRTWNDLEPIQKK